MRILIPFLCAVAIALPTKARELDVVVGWNKPPYVISQEHSGFEIDLVRAILAEMGHTLSPIYVPFGRTARLLKDSTVDIGLTQSAAHDIDDSVLSDPYIIYQNVVGLAECPFTLYYEFGTKKDDPYQNAQEFEPHPWTIEVTGHAEKIGTFHEKT